jgi:protein-S-isoprenylcysteine O-methyltransferase Ste14
LPTVVAFIVPLLLAPRGTRFHRAALPITGLGLALLLSCVRDFYAAGEGTLAPWAPPKHLVQVGLYRVSRNPMYLAVLVILIGWAVGFGSLALALYAAIVAIAFFFRVVTYEEPLLARTFGAEWLTYRARVPRWLLLTRRKADHRDQAG